MLRVPVMPAAFGRLRTRDVDEAVRIWRATSRTTPVEIFITAKGRECGRGIELAIALSKRGVPASYDPVSAREDKLNWVDGGWKTCRGPFSPEQNAIHYTRVGP